jgi:hypothetical protein
VAGEGLKRVSSEGGYTETLTTIIPADLEWRHNQPVEIPEKDLLLFATWFRGGPLKIKSVNLRTGEVQMILNDGGFPFYLASGHLLYISNNALLASKFDISKPGISGPSIVLVNHIISEKRGRPVVNISSGGAIVYYPTYQNWISELITMGPEKEENVLMAEESTYFGPRFSPDGNKVAYWKESESASHVWIYDMIRKSARKLTDEGANFWPIWSPDGKKLAFPSLQQDSPNVSIYWIPIDRSEPVKPLLLGNHFLQPQVWTKDGKQLIIHQIEWQENLWDILILDEDKKTIPYLSTKYYELKPDLSPDNRWIAYESNISGKNEIYLARFPEKKGEWIISTDGGMEPVWSPDGKAVYYRNSNRLMRVYLKTEPEPVIMKPEVVFEMEFNFSIFGRSYDISPEDGSFVMTKDKAKNQTTTSISLLNNIIPELKEKLAH